MAAEVVDAVGVVVAAAGGAVSSEKVSVTVIS